MQAKIQKKAHLRRRTNYGANLSWQDWTRQHLGSKYLSASDIDVTMLFRETDRDKQIEHLMLVEVKCFAAQMPANQRISFNLIHTLIQGGVKFYNSVVRLRQHTHHVKYYGFHFLQFEKTSPADGRIWWNNEEITENELIQILSFENAL